VYFVSILCFAAFSILLFLEYDFFKFQWKRRKNSEYSIFSFSVYIYKADTPVPPQSGWESFIGKGKLPAPTITFEVCCLQVLVNIFKICFRQSNKMNICIAFGKRKTEWR
jgi:hypothetical protein